VTVLRLALVVGILAGLLTMHTLITASTHTPTAAASIAAPHHAETGGGAVTGSPVSDDCAGSDCDPGHAMGLMSCILALLVAWVLASIAPPSRRRLNALPAAALTLVAALRSVAPPPPSLVALSISRT
jgi:hypothetical protein